MKKYIRIVLPIIIILVIIILIYQILAISKQQNIRNDRVAHLPLFELKKTNGIIFSNSNLRKGVPVIFIYFNSECDLCQVEAKDLVKNIREFKDVQLVFVSFERVSQIVMFKMTYSFDIYDNVVFLCDYKKTFSETFGVRILPSSIIYDKKGKLVCRNNGAVKVEYLLKVLKNER